MRESLRKALPNGPLYSNFVDAQPTADYGILLLSFGIRIGDNTETLTEMHTCLCLSPTMAIRLRRLLTVQYPPDNDPPELNDPPGSKPPEDGKIFN